MKNKKDITFNKLKNLKQQVSSGHDRKVTATTSNTVNQSYQCETIKELIRQEKSKEKSKELGSKT